MDGETPDIPIRAKGDDVSLFTTNDADAINALDALAEQEGVKSEGENENEPTKSPEEIAAEEKAAADKAAAEKSAAEKPAGEKTPEQIAAEKAAAEKPGSEKDKLDSIELPPHTKPKSAEAFGKLKQTAREEISSRDKQLAEVRAQLDAANVEVEKAKASANRLSPELQAEVEELRKFRLAHDVESDPSFREFDGKIKSNTESIYKKLAAAGIPSESIEKIKALGGPEAVDWEPVLPKLPLSTRRFIEATLVENVKLSDDKAEALEKAKSNAGSFLQERSHREVQELTDTANHFLRSLPWTAEQKVPANATPEQKAQVDAANEFARNAQAQIKQYLSDRSPARFAELAVGTLIAYKQKDELAQRDAQVEALTKDRDQKVEALTKERDKLKADLEAIRRAEAPRVRGDAVLPPRPSRGSSVHKTGAEALEELAREEAARSE